MRLDELAPGFGSLARALACTGVLAVLPLDTSLGAAFDDSRVLHIDYPAWFEETPFLDLSRVTADARAAGKRGLMVLFTTEGCSYCAEFIRRSLGDPGITARVRERFLVVGLEIFDDAEMIDPRGREMRVKAFADAQGAEYSPTLVFFDSRGEPILRVVGYRSPERFRRILARVSGEGGGSPPGPERAGAETAGTEVVGLREDPLFAQPPYALDRSRFAAERPLLVIFEGAGCDACTSFHEDVLAVPEVRGLLAGLEVVRLDAADATTPVLAPDGSRTDPAAWFRALGLSDLPALVFFDERGEQVLETDALVLRQRMMNSLGFVLERAYEKGWTYQRFARSKGLERHHRGD